jgi:hypothetical protein
MQLFYSVAPFQDTCLILTERHVRNLSSNICSLRNAEITPVMTYVHIAVYDWSVIIVKLRAYYQCLYVQSISLSLGPPQSEQSVPKSHVDVVAPVTPSSQTELRLCSHSLLHTSAVIINENYVCCRQ